MTLKELSQLYYLNREIEMLKSKIAELEAQAANTANNITGMPKGGGISDKTGRIGTEIAYYKAILDERILLCRFTLIKLNEYISKCDDSFVRLILEYRFINGLPWQQVAANIGMSATEYSVKKAAYRYIKKH